MNWSGATLALRSVDQASGRWAGSPEDALPPSRARYNRCPPKAGYGPRVVPADLDVHLVWDNYATHKAKIIRDWLLKRPRWYVHLTPTSSSWLNQVERFFALLTDKQIRRGVHRSVAELEAAIQSFLEQHNVNAKAFNWIKSADDILAAIERYCVRSNTISRII